jgi:hypothetical protein
MTAPKLRLVLTQQQLDAQRHAAAYGDANALGIKWYRNFPGDNLSVSRGWPSATLGLYHALRELQWDRGALPADSDEMRRLLGRGSPREWREAWPLLQPHFPVEADNTRRNVALARERYSAIGIRWQQLDAINMRYHEDWYRGKSADLYVAVVATAERTGVGTDEPSGEPTSTSTSRSKKADDRERGDYRGNYGGDY